MKLVGYDLYTYPSYKNIKWELGVKFSGVVMGEIPKYYFEWYLKNGTDEYWVETAEAWLCSLEAIRLYAEKEDAEGFEYLADCTKDMEVRFEAS
jgi:hypothetical protein